MTTIRRVAVLGAGTMGSRIAAHFANAGVPALLLDVVAEGEADRNAVARRGLDAASAGKPTAFFTDATRSLIRVGNFDDDLGRIRECDWVLEAIVEDRETKRDLWRRAELHARQDAILSTNTSGIPIGQICEGFSPEFRRRFLGVHFFNPPRYLHLVELTPGPDTDDDVVLAAGTFCDLRLGKGVIPCKDTPNFTGNRIGAFFFATVQKLAADEGYSVTEADALTGPLIGLPKSASFRLLDIIGLDVWKAVLENLSGNEADPWRDRFQPPPFVHEMISRRWLGEKCGQGFYRRAQRDGARVIEAIDLKTLEYAEAPEARFPAVDSATQIEDFSHRLRHLVHADDRAGRFLWRLLRDVFLYSAERVPEISDRVVEIDRALRWGYAFRSGPFELWDALGFVETARRIESDGSALPENVHRMLSSGAESFYQSADEDGEPRTRYFDLVSGSYGELEERPGVIRLDELKRARGVVRENPGASLIDLGDGALCLEFHTKMNVFGEDVLHMARSVIDETERSFLCLVIANEGAHFSAGANLTLFLQAAREKNFNRIDALLKSLQEVNLALRYSARPVVAAPFGYTLGGGCELVLHTAGVRAAAELAMGLVEVNVGLVPAAGGCKQMLLQLGGAKKAHALIREGRMSTSAAHAVEMGLLRPGVPITMNPDRLIGDAKALALSMAASYTPLVPGIPIEVEGEAVCAELRLGAWLARQSGRITDHDLAISDKLAHILTGGRLTGRQAVSEQYLLDLEREAFLSLCGTEKTLQRIEAMLRTGKPLRN